MQLHTYGLTGRHISNCHLLPERERGLDRRSQCASTDRQVDITNMLETWAKATLAGAGWGGGGRVLMGYYNSPAMKYCHTVRACSKQPTPYAWGLI